MLGAEIEASKRIKYFKNAGSANSDLERTARFAQCIKTR